MRTLWVLVLVGMTFAGCAEDSSPQEDEQSTAVDDELVATDETGVIRGVVVDATVTPVVGATVTILGPNDSTQTKDDGSFGFSDLDPATYFLKVTKPGWDPVQVGVDVEAGVALPNIVRVLMNQNATSQPYVATTQYNANLLCGLAVDATAFGCSVFRPADPYVPEVNQEVKYYEVLPDWLQVEMYWDSTQPAGESLLLNIAHCCDNGNIGSNGSIQGPSPLTAWVVKSEMKDAGVLEDGTETRVFPAGLDGTQVIGWGFGVVIDQQVEWFTNEFYNFVPNEGWRYISDGTHPVPS